MSENHFGRGRSAPEFFVGIDCGGTSTKARLMIPSAGVKKDFSAGPANFCSVKPEQVQKNLNQLFDQIKEVTGGYETCCGIGIGAAGAGTPGVPGMFRKCLNLLGLANVPAQIVTDAETAMYGALQESAGIVLVSGTGSICFGRDRHGRTDRSGGEGHLLGDGGSGYAVGRDILHAVLREKDGRGGKTVLTELVEEKAGLRKTEDILEYVYRSGDEKRRIAGFAPLLGDAVQRGDYTAIQIRDRAVEELWELAGAVITHLEIQKEKAAFSGSILRYMEEVSMPLKKKIMSEFPRITIIPDNWDALDGALMLAAGQRVSAADTGLGR